MRIWGLGGLGFHFIVNVIKRVSRKLRGIVPLLFGLLGENQKTFHFHGFLPMLAWPWLPQPILFIFGDTKIHNKMKKKQESFSENVFFGNRTTWKTEYFESVGKDRNRAIPTIRPTNSWTSWIWDHDLPEIKTCTFGNMSQHLPNRHQMIFETLKLRNFEASELWNFENLTPRSQ